MAPRILRICLSAALASALLILTSCADHDGGLFAPEDTGSTSTPGSGSPTGAGPGSPVTSPVSPTGSPSTGSSNGGSGSGNGAEPVPEPGTMLLFGAGLTGLAFYRRRRRPDADTLPI